MVTGLECSASPQTFRKGRGWRLIQGAVVGELTDCVYVMKPVKTQKDWVHRAHGLVSIWGCRDSGALGKGVEALCSFAIPFPLYILLLKYSLT